MNPSIAFSVLLFTAVQIGWAVAQCDANRGPPGVTACIKIRGYTHSQWATCLTDDYIKQKSGHRHHCLNRVARYCWYQCMVEVHSLSSGSVTSDCYCNTQTPDRFQSPPKTLPSACYSPSGNGSCNWFRDCLYRKYPCQDSSNSYAIRYAERFCSLYDQSYPLFGNNGRTWMKAAGKCLQFSLVPLIRPWVTSLTCQELRNRALASHASCYLNPDQNAPSICALDCSDFIKIFLTIRASFSKLDTAWQSMKGLWNIGNNCGAANSQIPKCLQGGEESLISKGILKIYKITVVRFELKSSEGSLRSVQLTEADARSQFADAVGSFIVRSLKWNTGAMDWFAYPEEISAYVTPDPYKVNIFIVLADKKSLGIVNTSIPFVNFNHMTVELVNYTKGDKLPSQVGGYKVWMRSLATCFDKSCISQQTLAESDKTPDWYHHIRNDASSTFHHAGLPLGITSILFMLFNKLF